ncbi:MAG: porin [Aquabacterium sp.]|nr:MAG: porin [Aquabacterium sp.]
MNRPLPTRLALAMSAAGLALTIGAPAQADEGIQWKFSAFGTLGFAHSSDDKSDFVGDIFQPNGAGKTSRWSLNPDTRLGGQIDAIFNDQWSAVLQLVSKHQYDGTFRPMVEWANVKWRITPAFSLRAGRIAAPSYLLSESRFVGYANPWVRPPVEAYSVLSITSNDGIDATYRHAIGSAQNTIQAYFGTSTAKLTSGDVKSKPAWGLNDTVELGSLTMRIGYTNVALDANLPSLTPLFNGMAGYAAFVPAAATQVSNLTNKYKLDDMKLSAISLGATYDPGQWFLMSEVIMFKGDGFLSDSTSWYVSAGYRFGTFTPYITHSRTQAHIEHETGITFPGASGINDGINQTLRQFTPTQKTSSIGLRWDFQKNLALKTQYDYTQLGKNSNGRMRVAAGDPPASRNINVFSVVLDFVF